jgi:hypothetical protein
MSKIRLGIIRADTHGYYFGMMLDECDPLLLQKYNYVVHYYATNIYDAELLTMPKVSGFEIVKVYDTNIKTAREFSETFKGKPVVCETVEEMTDGIDAVFIADCDGSGVDHLGFARPFLEKGITTFVDKPFASTLKDAKEIVRLAEKNNALLFNSSILSVVPAAEQFKRRFDEISNTFYPVPAEAPEGIGLGIIKGVGGAFSQELSGKGISSGIEDRMAYIIHGVCLALNLFGCDVEWVEAMGQLPLEYTHLHMKSGREVMILNTSTDLFPESCSFYASAYSKFGAVHSGPIGDPQFLGGGQRILQILKEMINTGKPPIDYHDFIKPIAIIEAAQLAQKKGKRVFLEDVLNG